jgi:biopolymer transport protein TolQ
MDRAVETAVLAGSKAVDFSVMGLFLNADWIVKTVIIMLILASIWSWAIIIEKFFRLRKLHGHASDFEDMFWSGGSLEDLYDRIGATPPDPMSAMFGAAMREWRRSTRGGGTAPSPMRAGLHQRIERVMHVTLGREMDRLERYMTFLANVGSTAPFIGLFGTVWGIMNSFHAIGAAKNTSLAVVAPGISEALIATAAGLAAAIPAVIAFNYFMSKIRIVETEFQSFSADFLNIIERDILRVERRKG